MPGKVYLDGPIVDPAQATISVFDRGFLYGDSVFETLRVYSGRPFACALHLERLVASGERVGFELPWSASFIEDNLKKTLEASQLKDAYVRIIATRGSGTLGLDPALATSPKLIMLVLDLPVYPKSLYEQGIAVRLVSVTRMPKRTVDPLAKTGNYLNSVLATAEAKSQGADDAIMLDREGRIAEASAANVFVRLNDVWCTPPLDVGILSGITRKTIIEVLKSNGVAVEERILWPDDMRQASEIFLCASVREIVPVVKLDDAPVGSGTVGSHTRRVRELYQAEVKKRLGL